jgi:hypothetical protein
LPGCRDGIREAFKKLRKRLELTEREQGDASRCHNEIRDYLKTEFDITSTSSPDLTSDGPRRSRSRTWTSFALWARKSAIAAIKPFDVLFEGLLSTNSRGDRTPLELFISGVRGLEAKLCRHIVGLSDGKRP